MTTKAIEAGARADLLPCPFCGEKRIFFNAPDPSIGFKGSINCPACLASVPREVNDDQELIDCWNTRPRAATTDEMVRAAQIAHGDVRLSAFEPMKSAIEAAIASGELVPASAVSAERERCAAVADGAMLEFVDLLEDARVNSSPEALETATICAKAAREIADKIRALEPASGEFVLVPREATKEIIAAYIAADPRRRRFAASAKRDYRAMLTASTSNGSGK